MAYRLLEKFKQIIGSDPVFTINAAIAPSFFVFPWHRGEHELPALCINKGRDSHFAINENGYFALATDKFREYIEGKVSLDELNNQYAAYESAVQATYDEVTDRDIQTLTNEELQGYMRQLMKYYLTLLETIYIETFDYDKALSVVGAEQKGRLDRLWEQGTQSTFISFEGRYLGKMLEIIASPADDGVRKTAYIFTDYFRTKSRAEIARALDEVRAHVTEKREEFEHIKTTVRGRKAAHEAWCATLDGESKKIAGYMQLVMRLRDVRKDPIAQMLAMQSELGLEMVRRAGIDARFISVIILHEYAKGVAHLAGIKGEIEGRAAGCIYLAHADLTYEIEHCDFARASKELGDWIHHSEQESGELRGQIAYRGIVRGVARIITDPHDDRGFVNGDILVTSMTRPEFVPIMKRAGAVVTNEGGITCHAAIVSRELGIPCVIGTKHATRVLHDGDFVEVDADNGVVRILHKNSD